MAARDAARQVFALRVSGDGRSTAATTASGHALTDDERWPWRRAIVAWTDGQIEPDQPGVNVAVDRVGPAVPRRAVAALGLTRGPTTYHEGDPP